MLQRIEPHNYSLYTDSRGQRYVGHAMLLKVTRIAKNTKAASTVSFVVLLTTRYRAYISCQCCSALLLLLMLLLQCVFRLR
jgi:hypothetical protein